MNYISTKKIEKEKFYPGLGIEPGCSALRVGTLPLSYQGQAPKRDRINLLQLSSLWSREDNLYVLRPMEACIHKLWNDH